MLLLIDIGNTHTHMGLASGGRILRQTDVLTAELAAGESLPRLRRFVGRTRLEGAALCSVVPRCTPVVCAAVQRKWKLNCLVLSSETLAGLGIGVDYPKPKTIGPDRLANAVAARRRFGAPVVVVDFGTAVTFDVVNREGDYIGGIIAPGLAAMTEYLHEKTALLPRIKIREPKGVVGKSTEEAMLIGAVHGYRGLVRELIKQLKSELRARRLPVVATGGYGELIAAGLPEITTVDPLLTLQGLRMLWESRAGHKVGG
ncbi:MAG TPA: type III pantothenate kinase [Verrucomicrobiae bacterium]|nr:type III pantothenate kinase [Verrucomicrobiae bacterium]